MALIKKQESSSKKEQGNKEEAKKAFLLGRGKKATAKKDSGKVVVKKDRINRVEQTKKFFRGVFNELKKVHWLNSREVIVYTSVVLLAVVAVGCLIWLFDSIMSSILRFIIR